MSKRSIFTTVTHLPPSVSRAAVLSFLHDYEAIIDLNPLVIARNRIPAPANADPDEALRVWYRLTDAIIMPWSSSRGNKDSKDLVDNDDKKQRHHSTSSSSSNRSSAGTSVSYTCVFHPLPDGLQTHCRAPLGVDIRERWTVAGTLPGEPRQPIELGLARLGAPAVGLYLREDVDLRCNHLMAGFVKKTLKRSHASLVAHLSSLAAAGGSAEERRGSSSSSSSNGSTPTADRTAGRNSDKSTANSDSISASAIPSSFLCPRLPSSVPLSPPSTPCPPSSTVTPSYPYPLPRLEGHGKAQHTLQQQQHHHHHRPRFPAYRDHESLPPATGTAPPAALLAETQQLNNAPRTLKPRQLLSEKQDRGTYPEYLLQPHVYDAGNGKKAKSTTSTATSGSGQKDTGLYPEPLRVPKQHILPQARSQTQMQAQMQMQGQPIPQHPDYPIMSPYDDDLDSPVLGCGDDKENHGQLPVFVELAADLEMRLVPVMLDTGRHKKPEPSLAYK